MIERTRFESVRNKYGHYASWAIWANEEFKPKENIGDLSIFDIDSNPTLLNQLNSNIVLVGLNISRPILAPFGNFHDSRPSAMDYKIRYALRNSPYWGAYMTDIIKDFEQKVSGKLMSYLRANRAFEEDNIQLFREELSYIRSNRPQLVAFGSDSFTILNRYFKDEFKIAKIPHYSNYISKEKYREEVKAALNFD